LAKQLNKFIDLKEISKVKWLIMLYAS
jgi:hypothetical protein